MILRVSSGSLVSAGRMAPLRVFVASRGLSSLKPLDEEYLGTPSTIPTAPQASVTKVSTLPNGAKVITHESGQLGAAVGVIVGSGARDELAPQTGASLQMELMAFKLTEDRSSIRLMRDVEAAGGNLAAARGREKMVYVSECPPESAGAVLSAIADSVVSPKIVAWEMADASAKAQDLIFPRHGQSTATMADEALHSAAFGDSYTLGKPLTVPCSLSADGLKEFLSARYKAPAITVVGVNVPHEEFAGQAEAALEAADTSVPAPRTPAKYIGGEIRVKHELGITSMSMAYSAPGGADANAPAYEVLGALLNNRASATVLRDASGFSVSYSDAGLVGVTGSCANGNGGVMTEALLSCFKGLAEGPSDAEVQGAIASAKIARGLRMEKPLYAALTLGKMSSVGADPVAAESTLDGVTVAAVKAAAMAAAKTELSVGAVGNISEIPLKQELVTMI